MGIKDKFYIELKQILLENNIDVKIIIKLNLA